MFWKDWPGWLKGALIGIAGMIILMIYSAISMQVITSCIVNQPPQASLQLESKCEGLPLGNILYLVIAPAVLLLQNWFYPFIPASMRGIVALAIPLLYAGLIGAAIGRGLEKLMAKKK